MKQAVKESAPHSGIMSIGTDVRKLVDKKVNRWIESAKRQGQDIDKMGEQELKYLIEINKPKAPKVYSNEEAYGILNRFMNQNKRGEVIKGKFGKPFAEEIVTVERVVTDIKKLEPIDAMKEANKVLRGEGRYKSLSKADREKIVNDESVTDHIFERNIEPDPEDFAQGGRTGLSYLLAEDTNERMPFSMGRRAFLKLMGGAAAGIGALKTGALKLFGKEGATVAKELTQVPIKNIEGMPSWFKPLVNRVIREGDDVTKQFATKEREIVHQVSLEGKIGSPDALGLDDIRVTQSLDDGTIRVQYNTVNSPGEYGVDLIYKKGEEIPTKKGSVKTKDEFTAAEAEPRYTGGPEDADLEWYGENLVNNVDDLLTDTTKLEAYATGKKPNIKKLLKSEQKQKKIRQLNESNAEQANFIEEKYGPGPDPSDLVDDYASGGIAKMLGE